MPTAEGHAFRPANNDGPVLAHDNATLAAWVNRGDLVHTPGKFAPDAGFLPLTASTDGLSLIDDKVLGRLNVRRAFVSAFIEMEGRGDGSIKRTEKAVS